MEFCVNGGHEPIKKRTGTDSAVHFETGWNWQCSAAPEGVSSTLIKVEIAKDIHLQM